jgi:peptide/nickel transport system ATP-binding protein
VSAHILSVEHLAVTFAIPSGEVPAVRDVSFHLERGEALGIVGESGSGKTVTCRSLLGLLPPTARVTGRIDIDGADVTSLTPKELSALRGRKAGMIFQNPSSFLDPVMRVGRQIGEGLRLHEGLGKVGARESSIRLLEHVRIPEPEQRVDAYPHELSGGMKQRVMIAGALACRPQILIADEPTTALDVTVQARILELLQVLREEDQLSLILVSHDLGVIASICDRVVVMNDGLVVEKGLTREVMLHPQAEYTRELIAANPALELKATSAPAVTPVPTGPPVGGSEDILTVEGLSVTFGRVRGRLTRRLFGPGPPPVQAVRDVSFTVREGEILGIVGESGSGKTTIGRAVVGLTEPSSGSVTFHAKAAQHGPSGGAVQMVFQDPFASLNPRMTVQRALAEPLRRHRLCEPADLERRVRELMDWVELPGAFLDRRPHELSGGQCQRVAIARALTVEPRLLIADEVTSALDVTIQKQILDLLHRLREELQLTIVLISHDLGVVQALCDRIAVMRAGAFVEQGSVDQILRSPREDYTRELIAAFPRIPTDGP